MDLLSASPTVRGVRYAYKSKTQNHGLSFRPAAASEGLVRHFGLSSELLPFDSSEYRTFSPRVSFSTVSQIRECVVPLYMEPTLYNSSPQQRESSTDVDFLPLPPPRFRGLWRTAYLSDGLR